MFELNSLTELKNNFVQVEATHKNGAVQRNDSVVLALLFDASSKLLHVVDTEEMRIEFSVIAPNLADIRSAVNILTSFFALDSRYELGRVFLRDKMYLSMPESRIAKQWEEDCFDIMTTQQLRELLAVR